MIGRIMTVAVAIRRWYRMPASLVKTDRATGSVRIWGRSVTMSGQRNSFQLKMTRNSPIVTRAGRASGTMIWKRNRMFEQPSIRAALYRLSGTDKKYWRSRKMQNALAVHGRISAV